VSRPIQSLIIREDRISQRPSGPAFACFF